MSHVLVVKFLMVFGDGGFGGMLSWLVPKIGCTIEGIKKVNCGRPNTLFFVVRDLWFVNVVDLSFIFSIVNI
jgi:hypothetical protein